MKINIGGTKRKSDFLKQAGRDWKIVDVLPDSDYQLDLMKDKLPFKNNSIDAIYSSHTLEHIFIDKVPFVLSEMFRVLKPNHWIRLVVPDVDIPIDHYIHGDDKIFDRKNPKKADFLPREPIYYLHAFFCSYVLDKKKGQRSIGGHVMVFNFETLSDFLSKSGFVNIEKRSYNKQRKVFRGCDNKRYKGCSLYVEAKKT